MRPWKIIPPQDPFETCTIFRQVHSTAPEGKVLLRLWLYSLPNNPRSKPPLCVEGEIGSGKTRTVKAMAELFGIPWIAQKVADDGEAHFWPAMNEGGLLCLDNADTKCKWLADAVANAATDGCCQRRRLYTDAENITLRARASLAITTSNPTFASDPGMADRLQLIRMRQHEGETSDAELSAEIAANRDAGLCHIAQTISRALADTTPTPCGLNARHPDFASFAVRIGRALAQETQAIAALQAAEAEKSVFCLENDPIATALLAFLRASGAFSGTAAELAPHMAALEPDLAGNLSAKKLGKRLSAIWPHLQKKLAKCGKETGRTGALRFTFAAHADFAGFQMPLSHHCHPVTANASGCKV